MIQEYIQAALVHARYEIIEDKKPYYGEIQKLKGVWANGKTLEECRFNLIQSLEGWIITHLRHGLPLPRFGNAKISAPKELAVHA